MEVIPPLSTQQPPGQTASNITSGLASVNIKSEVSGGDGINAEEDFDAFSFLNEDDTTNAGGSTTASTSIPPNVTAVAVAAEANSTNQPKERIRWIFEKGCC